MQMCINSLNYQGMPLIKPRISCWHAIWIVTKHFSSIRISPGKGSNTYMLTQPLVCLCPQAGQNRPKLLLPSAPLDYIRKTGCWFNRLCQQCSILTNDLTSCTLETKPFPLWGFRISEFSIKRSHHNKDSCVQFIIQTAERWSLDYDVGKKSSFINRRQSFKYKNSSKFNVPKTEFRCETWAINFSCYQ